MTADVAWSVAVTRRAWLRSAGWGLLWLVAGVLLLVAFLMYVSTTVDEAARLRSSGVGVNAVAVADSPESLRCGQVAVPIRFTFAGRTRSEQLVVNGCSRPVRAGDTITIYVDPSAPDRFVSHDSTNEKPLAVLAAVVALLAGLTFVVSATVRAWRLSRSRESLRRSGWIQATVRVISLPGKIARSHRILVLEDREAPVLVKLPFILGDNARSPPGRTRRVVMARGHEGWWAIASEIGSRPIAAEELHSDTLRSRTFQALTEPPG